MTIKKFTKEWGPAGPRLLVIELVKLAMKNDLNDADVSIIEGVISMIDDLETVLNKVRI